MTTKPLQIFRQLYLMRAASTGALAEALGLPRERVQEVLMDFVADGAVLAAVMDLDNKQPELYACALTFSGKDDTGFDWAMEQDPAVCEAVGYRDDPEPVEGTREVGSAVWLVHMSGGPLVREYTVAGTTDGSKLYLQGEDTPIYPKRAYTTYRGALRAANHLGRKRIEQLAFEIADMGSRLASLHSRGCDA